MEFYGYLRPDGQIGSRNYVAVVPCVVCVNEVVQAIVSQTTGTTGYFHHKGCCQLPPDLEMTTDSLIGLCLNPNVGAVLLVSLGCEGTDVERLLDSVKASGKPCEMIRVQELGGMTPSICEGVRKAQSLQIEISGMQRQKADMSQFVMGIKCGGSDTTSGLASNPVVGYVADRVIEEGGTVLFGETTEFIGAEHILARRAVNEQVGQDIFRIVSDMETRAKSLGVDMRKGQPTPGNIKGGLSSIEEKSLGAIVKSGTKPIQGVLRYTEKPRGKGLWIKDTPGREIEVLTAMAIGGAQCMLFSTGVGAPQGFPTAPVIKICGNPNTYRRMSGDMDIDAGQIILGNRSIEEVGEETYRKLIRTLSGESTKSEAIRYTTSMDIYTIGPVI